MKIYPFVSVIIPVFNDVEGLCITLNALEKQTYPRDHFEVIVSDNNSAEPLEPNLEIFKESSLNIQCVSETKYRGAGAARNAALPYARGEIIAFTDANCIPRPNWLEEGIRCFRESSVDRVAGEILIEPISVNSPAAAILSAVRHLYQKELYENYSAAATANLFIKKVCLNELAGFHHDFLEDLEFGLRARDKNVTIAYNPHCQVVHAPRSTISSVWYKGIKHGRGTFAICASRSEWAGKWGWKHFLRPLKILTRPYELYWERLPFPKSAIPWRKRCVVHGLSWVVVNLAEAWGYIKWGTRSILKRATYDGYQ